MSAMAHFYSVLEAAIERAEVCRVLIKTVVSFKSLQTAFDNSVAGTQ
jgi:hypothetical protein